jgi:polysaccharide chain length determinant protein (PEP-CTERM system associated)
MKKLENLTISDYIAIFRRRIWYVLGVTVLVSAGAVWYALQLPLIFRSETTIAMSSRLVPEDYIRSIDRQTNSDQMDFVRQQLQSRIFLEGIIREFHLADPGPEGFSDGALFGVGKRIEVNVLTASAFKLAFTATDRNMAQTVTKRLAERVIQLNDSFRKEKVQSADQFLGDQLREAADALSAAEQKMLQFQNHAFAGATMENISPDSLRELQIQLTVLETKLDSAVDDRNALERRLAENRQFSMALKAPSPPPPVKATETHPPAPPPPPSPLENQLAVKRAELAAASARYTPLHPNVVQLAQEVEHLESLVRQQPVQPAPEAPKEEVKETPPLREFVNVDLLPAEIQAEINQLARDIAKMEQEKSALSEKIASYQTRLNPPPELAQAQAEISREYDVAKQRYTYLSGQRLNSELAARVDSSDNNEVFKVIDPANLPQRAAGPNRRMFASLGGLAGLLLGFGIAFLRDYMDPTLHTEDDASAETKLPILASIPNIADVRKDDEQVPPSLIPEAPGTFSLRHADSKMRNVILNPRCFEAEHYRLLHSRLLALQKHRPLKSILISSAKANEGKTFSACCIAGVLAQEPGKKVLLIDADLRKASATFTLGINNKKPVKTFNAVLAGEADFEESLLRCAEMNLHFLPADTTFANPTQVMSSLQLERLLRQATQAFDWVIVDSPPILAVSDASRMFPYCDGMLLVVHSGRTPMKLIRDSIQRLDRDRICGVLMNRVKTVQSSYYYGGTYGPYQRTDIPSIKVAKKSVSQLSEVE